ncbi:hypothetical protein EYF80_020824 [Liparis tanakae]|uniref:Uncharacterized protein n=1 Tax=Liparis tanakae TaxID=230148 RepID=A0A4Z2HVG9_9TELE|nr:hypothetical protein EYF80_020824 [Liparis tanakae]
MAAVHGTRLPVEEYYRKWVVYSSSRAHGEEEEEEEGGRREGDVRACVCVCARPRPRVLHGEGEELKAPSNT